MSQVSWHPCYRLVPSRYPPIYWFERVADPADWEALSLVEGLTNSHLRDELGDISLVPADDRVSGPGAGFVMAPFTHADQISGRFSPRGQGAYYAAHSLETAIAETVYHREQFLRATSEPPMEVDMRELRANLDGALPDIRGAQFDWPELYHLTDYSASQAWARVQRATGALGVVYSSVRYRGECAAVFVPRIVRGCRAANHYCYFWNGSRITNVYQKSGLRAL